MSILESRVMSLNLLNANFGFVAPVVSAIQNGSHRIYLQHGPGAGVELVFDWLEEALPHISWTRITQWHTQSVVQLYEVIQTMATSEDRHAGIMLEAYDASFSGIDRGIRQALTAFSRSGVVVIAGQQSLESVWPGDGHWIQCLDHYILPDLSEAACQAFCHSKGIRDDAMVHAIWSVAKGKLGYMVRIGDMLETLRQPIQVESMEGFCIEQIIKPGSRRSQWRMDAQDPLDHVIGLASLLPAISLELVQHVLGFEIGLQGWTLWQQSDVAVHFGNEWYCLPISVGAVVGKVMKRTNEPITRLWKRRLQHILLAKMQSGSLSSEEILAWMQLIGFGGYTELSIKTSTKHGDGDWLLEAFTKDDRRVAGLYGHALSCGTLEIGLDFPEPSLASKASEMLLVRSVLWLGRYQFVRVLDSMSTLDVRLMQQRLGFERGWSRNGPCWELSLSRGFGQWLSSRQNVTAEGFEEGDLLAKKILCELSRPKVIQAIMQRSYGGTLPHDAQTWASWISKAIEPTGSGGANLDQTERNILWAYYKQRRGSHEDVAKMLHISRATYFRMHRRAMQKVGQWISQQLFPDELDVLPTLR